VIDHADTLLAIGHERALVNVASRNAAQHSCRPGMCPAAAPTLFQEVPRQSRAPRRGSYIGRAAPGSGVAGSNGRPATIHKIESRYPRNRARRRQHPFYRVLSACRQMPCRHCRQFADIQQVLVNQGFLCLPTLPTIADKPLESPCRQAFFDPQNCRQFFPLTFRVVLTCKSAC